MGKRLPSPSDLPHPTVREYIAGWRWGFMCGAVAGALVMAITLLVLCDWKGLS